MPIEKNKCVADATKVVLYSSEGPLTAMEVRRRIVSYATDTEVRDALDELVLEGKALRVMANAQQLYAWTGLHFGAQNILNGDGLVAYMCDQP